ncbi:hypothetical protein EXIGLDRAFT_728189 [Exidia glandulosa HHB12029]|uniref:Uncharacterized protein n=1 Tax=Exidia glandulosa HHB12029 TaxID=1314781 RepID=A0A165ZKW3_EXIGL|nr:hypothetical protein EXIGLDRAFT_728189 [Exidia glandulosa HHB12029]
MGQAMPWYDESVRGTSYVSTSPGPLTPGSSSHTPLISSVPSSKGQRQAFARPVVAHSPAASVGAPSSEPRLAQEDLERVMDFVASRMDRGQGGARTASEAPPGYQD